MTTRRRLQGRAECDDEEKEIPPQQNAQGKRSTKRSASSKIPGVASKKASIANESETSAARAPTAKGLAAKKPEGKGKRPVERAVPADDESISSSKSDDCGGGCDSGEKPGCEHDAAARTRLRTEQKKKAEDLRKERAAELCTLHSYPTPPTLSQVEAAGFSIKVGDVFPSKIHLQSASQTFHEFMKRRFKTIQSRQTMLHQACLMERSCNFCLDGRFHSESRGKPAANAQ